MLISEDITLDGDGAARSCREVVMMTPEAFGRDARIARKNGQRKRICMSQSISATERQSSHKVRERAAGSAGFELSLQQGRLVKGLMSLHFKEKVVRSGVGFGCSGKASTWGWRLGRPQCASILQAFRARCKGLAF